MLEIIDESASQVMRHVNKNIAEARREHVQARDELDNKIQRLRQELCLLCNRSTP